MPASRSLIALAAASVCLAAPHTPTSAAATRPATTPAPVTLTASVVNSAGKAYYRRTVRLASLERADVRVIRRTASSITVESRREGSSGPRATLALRIVPGKPDVLGRVRAVVPDAQLEGTVTGFERRSAPTEPKVPVVLSAFRIGTTVYAQGRFGGRCRRHPDAFALRRAAPSACGTPGDGPNERRGDQFPHGPRGRRSGAPSQVNSAESEGNSATTLSVVRSESQSRKRRAGVQRVVMGWVPYLTPVRTSPIGLVVGPTVVTFEVASSFP